MKWVEKFPPPASEKPEAPVIEGDRSPTTEECKRINQHNAWIRARRAHLVALSVDSLLARKEVGKCSEVETIAIMLGVEWLEDQANPRHPLDIFSILGGRL